MTTVYIVDDDPSAITLLTTLLAPYAVTIAGATTDLDQARHDIPALQPDLLFLDVEMPTMTGLDFCAELRPQMKPDMKVVFYTGYDKYILDALRRQAFDYMLKPATATQLSQLMNRYYENRLSTLRQAAARGATPPPIIMLADQTGEHTTIHVSRILYFQYSNERRLWEIMDTDGTIHPLRHRTNAEVILANSPHFVQVHKRFIVNINHVSRITDTNVIMALPATTQQLPVSRSYRHDLLNAFYSM